jgi:hypothetical protein
MVDCRNAYQTLEEQSCLAQAKIECAWVQMNTLQLIKVQVQMLGVRIDCSDARRKREQRIPLFDVQLIKEARR